MQIHYVFLIVLNLCVSSLFSQTIVVDISNIRSKEGVIRLAVFTCNETFRKETPFVTFTFEKDSFVNGSMQVKLASLPPGTYGIALLDDENRNGRLDYHLLIPREGVGFSNYEHNRISQPWFDRFSFLLEKQQTIRVTIKVNYYR